MHILNYEMTILYGIQRSDTKYMYPIYTDKNHRLNKHGEVAICKFLRVLPLAILSNIYGRVPYN